MSERYMTVGWSDFALKRHKKGNGYSYSNLNYGGKPIKDEVCSLVLAHWKDAVPGDGETDLSRKVLVPVPAQDFFCPDRASVVGVDPRMPINAHLTTRQDGEDPFVETWVWEDDALTCSALLITPAVRVKIVCYSADALLENDGERTTPCSWEIVSLNCDDGKESPPMPPLTMARNMLEKPGGTKSEYTAQEFADAVYWHSTQKTLRVKDRFL